MGVFDNREKAQENKYFHDAELKFQAISRRNKLLGHWAAHELAVPASAVEGYVMEVVRADFQEPGDQDLIRKVLGAVTVRSARKLVDQAMTFTTAKEIADFLIEGVSRLVKVDLTAHEKEIRMNLGRSGS